MEQLTAHSGWIQLVPGLGSVGGGKGCPTWRWRRLYMPEVEHAPWRPDSWAPLWQWLASSGVLRDLLSREAILPRIYSLASLLHLGSCRVRDCSAARGGGTVPWAVAGQRWIGDKKGWEAVKNVFALPHWSPCLGEEGGCLVDWGGNHIYSNRDEAFL